MKKIIRLASVIALAGAALLYVGCTKDFSGDVAKVDQKVTDLDAKHKADVQNLETALNNAKTALQNAIDDNRGDIDQLISDLSELGTEYEGTVTALGSLQTLVGALQTQVGTNETTLNTLKTEYEAAATVVNTTLAAIAKVNKGQSDSLRALDDAMKIVYNQLFMELPPYGTISIVGTLTNAVMGNGGLLDMADELYGMSDDLNEYCDSLSNVCTLVAAKLQGDIDSLGTELSTTNAKVKEIIEVTIPGINTAIENINKEIDALWAAVEALQVRITSIASYPSLNEEAQRYILDDVINKVVFKARFKIAPAEAAKSIKAEDLKVLFKTGISKGEVILDTAFVMDVDTVILRQDDVITVQGKADNFPNYSLREESKKADLYYALYFNSVDKDSANYEVISDFDKVVEKDEINITDLTFGTTVVADSAKIPYAKMDTSVTVALHKGAKLFYSRGYFGVEELCDLLDENIKVEYVKTIVGDTATQFKVVDNDSTFTVELKNETVPVGSKIDFKAAWNIIYNDTDTIPSTLRDSAIVVVVKNQKVYNLGSKTANWTWKAKVDSFEVNNALFDSLILGTVKDVAANDAESIFHAKNFNNKTHIIVDIDNQGYQWSKNGQSVVARWDTSDVNATYTFEYTYTYPILPDTLVVDLGTKYDTTTTFANLKYATKPRTKLVAAASANAIEYDYAAGDSTLFTDNMKTKFDGVTAELRLRNAVIPGGITSLDFKTDGDSFIDYYQTAVAHNGFGDYTATKTITHHGVVFILKHQLKLSKPADLKLVAIPTFVNSQNVVNLEMDLDSIAENKYVIKENPIASYMRVDGYKAGYNLGITLTGKAVNETFDVEDNPAGAITPEYRIDFKGRDTLALDVKAVLLTKTGSQRLDSLNLYFKVKDPIKAITPDSLTLYHSESVKNDSINILQAFNGILDITDTKVFDNNVVTARGHAYDFETSTGAALTTWKVNGILLEKDENLKNQIAYDSATNSLIFKANQAHLLAPIVVTIPVTIDYIGVKPTVKYVTVTIQPKQN